METFVTAFAFGLAFCLSPGPVFTESLRRGLVGGFRPALIVQLGSLVGDLVWAILAFAGLGVFLSVPMLRLPMEIAGIIFLLWLAGGCLRDVSRLTNVDPDPQERRSRGAFRAGAILSLFNPKNLPFWLAIGGTMGGLGVPSPVSVQGAFFLSGFMAACVSACFLTAGAIAWLHRHLTPVLFRILNIACAAALALFAALGAISMVERLVG